MNTTPTLGNAARMIAVAQEIDARCAALRAGGHDPIALPIEIGVYADAPNDPKAVRDGLHLLRGALAHADVTDIADTLADVARAFDRMVPANEVMQRAYFERRQQWIAVDDALLRIRETAAR